LRRRIALLWVNKATLSFLEKNLVMKKIFYKKMRAFIRFFLFALWKSLIFICSNNYIFWRIWSSYIFFQSFIAKLGNPRVIFLYAFIIKCYNFLNQIRLLLNLWLICGNIKLYYIQSFSKLKYKHLFYKLESIFMIFYKFFESL